MRSVDLRLLLIGVAAGLLVVVLDRPRRRGVGRLGSPGVLIAVLGAVAGDAVLTDALPSPLVRWGAPTALGVGVGWLAGRGARRLGATPGRVPLVVLLVLTQLGGVWMGVPETSAAILAGGLLVGVSLVALWRGIEVTGAGAVALAALPVAATLIGGVGRWAAVLGGLLVSAILVIVGLAPQRRGRLSAGERAAVLLVQVGASASAARLVGVREDLPAIILGAAVSLALSGLGAWVLLRPAQRAP